MSVNRNYNPLDRCVVPGFKTYYKKMKPPQNFDEAAS